MNEYIAHQKKTSLWLKQNVKNVRWLQMSHWGMILGRACQMSALNTTYMPNSLQHFASFFEGCFLYICWVVHQTQEVTFSVILNATLVLGKGGGWVTMVT